MIYVKWDLEHCTVTPSDKYYTAGSHTWTFKADSGYYFGETGGIINAFGFKGSQIPATGTDTTTLTHSLSDTIEVSLSATKKPTEVETPKYSITWDLTNCTVTPSDTSLEQGTHTWTFKANSGYYFDETGGIETTFGGVGSQIPATKTDTTTLTYDLENNIKIGLSASKIPVETPKYNITWDLTNCTVTPNDTSLEQGTHTWTFKANSGYYFDETGGIETTFGGVGSQIPATKTDTTTLTYDLENNIAVSLSASKMPVVSPTTIALIQKLTNVKSNITGASIDRKLNAISLTADPSYTFQTSIQILFYSEGKVVIDYNVDGNNKDSITIPLNTTKENTITDSMDKMQLNASATIATLSTGYEHNYLITDTELNAFSNDEIWTPSYNGVGDPVINVNQFINNIIELPFIVNTPTTVDKISVGSQHSNVVSHETKERFITLDLGTVTVPAKYKNGYDYQNKTIKLYTPFVPPITIDNDNAIEKTVHISYKIDISNGNLTVNLYNDNVLFFTGTNNVSSQLPFLNTLNDSIINRKTHFNDNNIRKPYIIVSRETPILNSDYYPTNERGLIKSYNGNIQVRLLNNMNIPNNELSELTSKLESGVKYVKSN